MPYAIGLASRDDVKNHVYPLEFRLFIVHGAETWEEAYPAVPTKDEDYIILSYNTSSREHKYNVKLAKTTTVV